MSAIDRLEELIREDDKAISKMATLTLKTKRLYADGTINKDDLDGVLDSIKSYYQIEKEASDIVRKQQLKEAMDLIIMVLKTGSSFV